MARKRNVRTSDIQNYWSPPRKPERSHKEYKIWQEIAAKDPSFKDPRIGMGPTVLARLKLRESGIRQKGSNPGRAFNKMIMPERDKLILKLGNYRPLSPRRSEARLMKALAEIEE